MENSDRFTRISYREKTSFFSEIKNSLGGVFVGTVLIIGSVSLQLWNEGRAVQTSRSLEEGLQNSIHISGEYHSQNDGRLIHLNGNLKTLEPLKDDEYAVHVHAVWLKRTVYMYQWYEESSKREYDDGSQIREETQYSYYTAWRKDVVSSKKFASELGHQNPEEFPVKSKTWMASPVNIGERFQLSKGLVSKIDEFEEFVVKDLPISRTEKIFDGRIYHSKNPQYPKVGDLKIEFTFAGRSSESSSEMVSVMAQQQGYTLGAYETDAGDSLEILHTGFLTAEEMIRKEKASNDILTWSLRGGGWLVMFLGFSCLTQIINTLVSRIPVVRDIVNLGTGALNFALSMSLSLLVIALGWIRYRPIVGLCIIACSLVPLFFAKKRSSEDKRK